MTFTATAPAGELARAFSMASRVSPKPNTNTPAIISNLHLVAKDGKLVVNGLNRDAGITVGLNAKGKGEITAPAAQLATVASRLDAADLAKLELQDNQLVVSQGRSRFKLPTLPANPEMQHAALNSETTFTCAGAPLATALKMTEGASAGDMLALAYLSGAYFDVSEKQAMLVCADKSCLAASPLDCNAPKSAQSVIIPPTAFNIVQMLAASAPEVTIGLGNQGQWFAITAGEVRFQTKTIDANFPIWRRLPRKEHATRVILRGDVLRRAMDRLTALGPAAVTIKFGDTIEITANAYEERLAGAGMITDAIEHETMTGPAQRVVVNSEVMKWIVASLPGAQTFELGIQSEDANITFADPARPLDVRLLMPIRG